MEAKIELFPLNDSPFSKELEIAKKEAEKSCHKIRHGALIVDAKKEFQITGSNSYPDNILPFVKIYIRHYPKKMLHAEFIAMGKAPREDVLKIFDLEEEIDFFSGATIFTYRLSKTGIPGMSKPCSKICWPKLQVLDFKDAVYITPYNGELLIAHEQF